MAFLLLAITFKNPPLYQAKLNFMLNEDEGSSLGGIANILGQFGLGSGGGSESNLDKILELSRARTIAQDALFITEELHGQSDYLANHLIHSLEKEKNWEGDGLLSFGKDEDLSLKGFRFTHNDFSNFSLLENKALKKIHNHLMGKELQGGAFQSDYSELSGIMDFSMTSSDASLSIKTVNKLFEKLSDYYLGKNSEKQEKDFRIIKSKYDSIQTTLDKVMYSIAQFEDKNRGLIKKQDSYRLKKMKGEEMKLGAMLAEAEKQYQIAQITRESRSEYIQVIDKPLLPLKPVNKGKIYYFLLGGFIGGLLAIGYLTLKKIYADIMSA